MHELSLCHALFKQIELLASQIHARRIVAIELQIGPLAGVEPSLLKNAFDLRKQNSIAQHAILRIEQSEIKAHCPQCHTDYDSTINDLRCPQCLCAGHLLSGNEILITGLDYN